MLFHEFNPQKCGHAGLGDRVSTPIKFSQMINFMDHFDMVPMKTFRVKISPKSFPYTQDVEYFQFVWTFNDLQVFRNFINSFEMIKVPTEILWVQDLYQPGNFVKLDDTRNSEQMKHLFSGDSEGKGETEKIMKNHIPSGYPVVTKLAVVVGRVPHNKKNVSKAKLIFTLNCPTVDGPITSGFLKIFCNFELMKNFKLHGMRVEGEKEGNQRNEFFQLIIKTVNVQSINSVSSCLFKNFKVEEKVLEKGESFASFISNNCNCILVLTETKVEEEVNLVEAIKTISDDAFWIGCNHTGGKAGVVTLVPKSLFNNPNFQNHVQGMVTECEISFVGREDPKITLVSYYNPCPNEFPNKDLSGETFARYKNKEKVIIAGDFNEILDVERDYISPNDLNEDYKKQKINKANLFSGRVKENNLHYFEKEGIYTHQSKAYQSEGRIDHIFYSEYFSKLEMDFSLENPNFSTDHKILKQVFHIPKPTLFEKTKIPVIYSI
eukprot:TRINITY_DN2923_c0_g1_i1.p1 TRINITY_DN2923_c0_g1~~TRINITY_DN2923_c0_g1_i1.p1  ORF type:complete len:492 (-),score=138.28 TRINITY_DN2923_c0_g1_i1:594-2069(-)